MAENQYKLAVTEGVCVKGKQPFRIGCTSFVFPADILPNVMALAEHVDDIELLRFESDVISPLPDINTILELKEIASDHNLTYTVHLPVDADIGAFDEDERINSVGKHLRVIERFSGLEPFSYVLHIPKPTNDILLPENISLWHNSLHRSVSELIEAGVNPELLAIETLDYPFEWIADFISETSLAVCMDIGHLLLYNYDIACVWSKYKDRIKVIHLHGIDKGKDHCSISYLDREFLYLVISLLTNDREFERVLTLELFGHDKLVDSIKTIAEIMNE